MERHLAEDTSQFKGCYLHPKRPAVRQCMKCERPICKLCEQESGDRLICLPCKEQIEEEMSPTALKAGGFAAPPRRETPVDISDVIVFGDGRVETVAQETAPAEPEPTPEELAESLPLVNVEPPPSKRVRKPIKREPEPEKAPEPAPRKRRAAAVAAVPAPEAAPEPVDEELPQRMEPRLRARAAAMKAALKRPPKPEKPPKPKKERKIRTGPLRQTLGALPYGILAALVVAGVWLIFPIFHRWNQLSIFTIGIAVPWALFRGSTRRKVKGERVWWWATRPLWLAIPSLVIVAGITPAVEYAAYRIMYGANPGHLPFGDFAKLFFNSTSWAILIVAGLVAFALPFFMSLGEEWDLRGFKRERGEVPEDVGDEENGREADPGPRSGAGADSATD